MSRGRALSNNKCGWSLLSRKNIIYVIIRMALFIFCALVHFFIISVLFPFFPRIVLLLKIPMVYNKKRERVLTENETCQAQKSSNDDTDHNNEDHHQVRHSCNTKKIHYKVSRCVYHFEELQYFVFTNFLSNPSRLMYSTM